MVAAAYDAIYRNDPERWASKARDEFARFAICIYQNSPRHVLDVGCGNGHTIAYLHEAWPGCKFYGIDLSQEAVNIASKRCPYASFFVGPIEGTPLCGSMDVITIMGVAEHFEDIHEGLLAAKALLAPDGIIYLEAPNNISISLQELSGPGDEGWFPMGKQMEWHLRHKTWEQKFEEAGLRVVEQLLGDRLAWAFVWILKAAQ